MLKRRPALGTEDVAGADPGAADRTAVVVGHPRRRGDGPRRGRLRPGNRFVAGRGAPGGPDRLVVLSVRRVERALPRVLDLTRPAVAVIRKRRLPVPRPRLRLGVR